ncbi:MAG: RidA family protein [Anaerolineae bacterium]|nr:RidA family protein [Anaerolineae bacterium]
MIVEKLKELGYEYSPADKQTLAFHAATKVGNLVFTSGQIPRLNDEIIFGKVDTEVDLETAKKAAEICAFNCLRAAGAVVDVEKIKRVVKVLGMVNVSESFNRTSEVINGCTEFLNKIFGEDNSHARSAVGLTLPNNFAVEIEMIFEVE